jgi:cytochrome c peroxidase
MPALLAAAALTFACATPVPPPTRLDRDLTCTLAAEGFTGRIEERLEARLGRAVDPRLAELGRLLFFDPIGALHEDNACAGCHAPRATTPGPRKPGHRPTASATPSRSPSASRATES